MNNILKLFIGGFIAISAVTCVRADDADIDDSDADVTDVAPASTANVVARMDCKALKAKIDELSANGASDELSRFQLQYRKDCVIRTGAVRTSRGGALGIVNVSMATPVINTPTNDNSVPAPVATETKTVEISAAQSEMCERLPDAIAAASGDARDTLQSTYDEYCAANVAAPDAVVKTTMMVLGPRETDEEKYAKIAANLDAGLCPDGASPNKFGCCTGEVFKDLGNLEFACCGADGGDCFPPLK